MPQNWPLGADSGGVKVKGLLFLLFFFFLDYLRKALTGLLLNRRPAGFSQVILSGSCLFLPNLLVKVSVIVSYLHDSRSPTSTLLTLAIPYSNPFDTRDPLLQPF